MQRAEAQASGPSVCPWLLCALFDACQQPSSKPEPVLADAQIASRLPRYALHCQSTCPGFQNCPHIGNVHTISAYSPSEPGQALSEDELLCTKEYKLPISGNQKAKTDFF